MKYLRHWRLRQEERRDWGIYEVDPKIHTFATMLCYATDVHAAPDLDATSSCDGSVSQFLGIRSRQGATERLVLVLPWPSTVPAKQSCH